MPMAQKKKKLTKKPTTSGLAESTLALSLLGTMWRTAFFAALMIVLSIAGLAKLHADWARDDAIRQIATSSPLTQTYPYVNSLSAILMTVAAFALFDAVYVLITKRYPIRPVIDKIVLLSVELFFAGVTLLVFALTLAVDVSQQTYNDLDTAVFAFLVIAGLLPLVRAFIGVSYVVNKRRR
ncbi:hypothetical protein CYG49_01085 [Candidatus Saccharibacteria bacterium]|nr:MAG: hypothetical protein CYG49_01085 [Candidatus Saccharibacteria bacterium]